MSLADRRTDVQNGSASAACPYHGASIPPSRIRQQRRIIIESNVAELDQERTLKAVQSAGGADPDAALLILKGGARLPIRQAIGDCEVFDVTSWFAGFLIRFSPPKSLASQMLFSLSRRSSRERRESSPPPHACRRGAVVHPSRHRRSR